MHGGSQSTRAAAAVAALLAASRAAVAVAVTEHAHGGSVACAAIGYTRQVTVALAAPLGGRVLVDAASGVAVTVLVLPAAP